MTSDSLDIDLEQPSGHRGQSGEHALIATMYKHLPVVLLINLGVALLTTGLLLVEVDLVQAIGWLGLLATSLILRYADWRAFARVPETARDPHQWGRRLAGGAGLTGICWGMAGFWFYDPALPATLAFVPFMLAGMVGGSAIALSGHVLAFVSFGLGAMAPFTLRLVMVEGTAQLIMALLCFLYILGVSYLARTFGHAFRASITLAAERRELVVTLRERSEQLQATIDGINQGVVVFGADGGLLNWNRCHRDLHQYPAAFYERGTSLERFLRFDREQGRLRHAHADLPGLLTPADPSQARDLHYEQMGAGGRILEVEVQPLPNGGFVSTSTDITARRRNEADMRRMAEHDPLTGLPNRFLFSDRLSQTLARARRNGELLAVLLLDLDKFKDINDAFGHSVGDHVLQVIAARLEGAMRSSDTVARIGGDEFALIVPEVTDPRTAALLGEKVIAELAPPVEIGGMSLEVAGSLGVALFPSDGADAEALLQQADLAMYRAKAAGGGFRVAGAPIEQMAERQVRLERELARALRERQLTLEFQPQVSLTTGEVAGVEALLRWYHPDLGRIETGALIAAAEASGQIIAIGARTLEEACTVGATWRASQVDLRLAVNISASQLQRQDAVRMVRNVLESTGFPADRLELEITETIRLPDTHRVNATLQILRGLGIELAVDDFGTGFASLSHLVSFPLSAIKIDRSFIDRLDRPEGVAIVRTTIDLAHRLGLRVTAEGAETEAQLETLRALGCDEAQGHAVSCPLGAAELTQWLAARAATRESAGPTPLGAAPVET